MRVNFEDTCVPVLLLFWKHKGSGLLGDTQKKLEQSSISRYIYIFFFIKKVVLPNQNRIVVAFLWLAQKFRIGLFHQLSPLGRVGLVVAMSVCLSVCQYVCGYVPSRAVFFEASHWSSGHMISSRPVIGPPSPTPSPFPPDPPTPDFLAILARFSGSSTF